MPNNRITIGFPRMKKEHGEKRVFLPEFIEFLVNQGASVFISEGYGSRSGFTFEDYQRASPFISMCSQEETFQQDYVIVLRSPDLEELELLHKNSCLISMLHFPTRSKRIELLERKGARAISMDCIVNDNSQRLIEDMKAVAWNGLEVAFDQLEAVFPGLIRMDGLPVHALVLGTGMVGRHAVDAVTKLGNIERNNEHTQNGGPGSIALAVGRNITNQQNTIKQIFSQSDILVDATQRRDTSKPVVPNEWIGWLPEHAIVTDLSVDPYTLDTDPQVVRGLEGIPQGNLDQYIFHPKDAKWDLTVPSSIPSSNRRTTVSCYSWPGIHPEASMRHYGQQMEPLMQALMKVGYNQLSLNGDYFERALYRASLKSWLTTIND